MQSIRRARPGDEPHIARFIRDLARYEHLEHHLNLSEARLSEHLFGETPVCSALLVEHEGRPVGFALFFISYSTFWCTPCLFLEDLYVDPAVVRADYLERHGEHSAELERICAQLGIEMHTLITDQPIENALFDFLSGRISTGRGIARHGQVGRGGAMAKEGA